MFEIGFGGQLGDLVCGELTAQEAAKQLAEFEARASKLQVLAGRAPQIHERECSGALGKSLDAQHQFSVRLVFDTGDPAHQIPPIIPGLQAQKAIARFQHEIISGDE